MSRVDLTGYTALFGESLASKVDLLGRLLGDSHYPSLGQYKERLLADAIRDFLPRKVEVGTGFVMFPHADTSPFGEAAGPTVKRTMRTVRVAGGSADAESARSTGRACASCRA